MKPGLLTRIVFITLIACSAFTFGCSEGVTGHDDTALLSDEDSVQQDLLELDIQYAAGDDEENVTQNLGLAATGANGTTITWNSSEPLIISSTGQVTRPNYQHDETDVTLTAAVSKNGISDTKLFIVTVIPAAQTDEEKVAADRNGVYITYSGSDYSGSVTQNITLMPSTGTGPSGTTITWQSGNTAYISNTGVVTRPGFYTGDVTVTMTATITLNDAQDTKVYTLTVIKSQKTDQESADEDCANLQIGYNGGDSVNNVRQNVTLAASGSNGTTITWESNNTDVINVGTQGTGIVFNPHSPASDAPVTLTATVSKNGSTAVKQFTVTVIAYSSYIYTSYFGRSGLYISTNGGLFFNQMPSTDSYMVGAIYINGSNIYISDRSNAGIGISTDGGKNFTRYASGLNGPVNSFYISGTTVYTGTGYNFATNHGTGDGGVAISNDGGHTFTSYVTGLPVVSGNSYVRKVVVLGSTVYAATQGGLSISTNGGTSYANYTQGLTSTDVRDVCVSGSTVYVATGRGVGRSTDGGHSFTMYTIANGLGNNSVSKVCLSGSTLYAATAGGLSISTNGGTSYTNYTQGLGSESVNDIFINGSTVYLAVYRGISISTDGGHTFNHYNNGLGDNADMRIVFVQ